MQCASAVVEVHHLDKGERVLYAETTDSTKSLSSGGTHAQGPDYSSLGRRESMEEEWLEVAPGRSTFAGL